MILQDIKYQLTFHTDWHSGSGQSRGADVDALVVKDANGLPFFGNSTDRNLIQQVGEKEYECMSRGIGFFTNVVLEESVAEEILKNHAANFLYRGISRTKIDENGLAVDQSLRRMEVVVPCSLMGEIHQIPEILKEDLIHSLGYIKRMGFGRNRGLGRCTIQLITEGGRA